MGYNGEGAARVLLDIETVAIPNALDFLDQPNAPRNYKDPEKIRAYREEALLEEVGKAALDLDLCAVVAIGWQHEHELEPTVITRGDFTEEQLLVRAWLAIAERVTVGKNTLGFDLPVLLRRSLYLGIQAPPLILDKYRTPHIDLQQRLSFNGAFKYRSLDFYCRRFGISVPGPVDAISGKDIADCVSREDWATIATHCGSDVRKTGALAERMGLWRLVGEAVA